MCCWIKLLPCSLLAKECVNRPYILASVPQNVAQHKMPLDVSFPSWPSSQLLTGSQQKKKRTERDLKLLFSRAHSTSHQTQPPPALLTPHLFHPPQRKEKNGSFFNCYYSLKSKIFNNVLYATDQMINIYDNRTAACICWLVKSKTWHLHITSIPWALQRWLRTRGKHESQRLFS